MRRLIPLLALLLMSAGESFAQIGICSVNPIKRSESGVDLTAVQYDDNVQATRDVCSATIGSWPTAGFTLDLTSAIFEPPNSPTLPASCTVAEIYIDNDATPAGQQVFVCSAPNVWSLVGDGGGGGLGDAIEVEDGDNLGTFTPIDTTARFDDAADINFVFQDGGPGGPDTVTAVVRADSVALTTDTTGFYAAGDAEAGAALTGDSATAFFSVGVFEDARVDGSLEADELVLVGDVDGVANVNDLDELAVQAELEAVLQLANLQGAATKGQLPAAIAYEDEANSFGANIQTMTRVHLQEQTTPAPPPADTAELFTKDRLGFTQLAYLGPAGQEITLGQDNLVVMRNETGLTIPAFRVVYESGTGAGGEPLMALADADSEATMPAMGLTLQPTLNNANGLVMFAGILTDQNTSGFLVGDILYVSQTPGFMTTTPPPHPALRQRIARVLSSSATVGTAFVMQSSVRGDHIGTNQNSWLVGSNTAGAKSLVFRNGFDMTITGNPTAARAVTLPDADSATAQAITCGGTDKVSAFSAVTGTFTCSADQTGAGGGDAIEIEDGDNLGTFTAIDTTARFDDAADINFIFADGGPGGPDIVTAAVRANAVTNTQAADMAANTVKVNATAGTADPADLAVGLNTVVGRAGGNIVAAQVATGQIAANAADNTIIRDSGALSVVGRSANSTGDPADISATATSGAVLRESGSTLGFGTVATTGIADNAVSYAKQQDVTATDRVIGRSTAGAGDPQEIVFSDAAQDFSQDTFAADQVWVSTAATAGTPRTVPQCTSAQKLQYTTGAGFTCVTDLTGGGGAPVEEATYSYYGTGVTMATGALIADLFNASGSGVVLRVNEVFCWQRDAAAVTGINAPCEFQLTNSAGTGGTTISVGEWDTADAAMPAQVTARTGATGGAAAVGNLLGGSRIDTEEGSTATATRILAPWFQSQSPLYVNHGDTTRKRIVLREGEGLRCQWGTVVGTAAGAAACGFVVQRGAAGASELPTYSITSNTTSTGNKVMMDVFNATGSGRILKILKINAYARPTAAVAGTVISLEGFRTSNVGTGGITITPGQSDSADAAVPAQVTAREAPTGGAASDGGALLIDTTGTDELATSEFRAGWRLKGGAAHNTQWVFDGSTTRRALVVRENEGFKLVTGPLSGAGNVVIVIEFTLE